MNYFFKLLVKYYFEILKLLLILLIVLTIIESYLPKMLSNQFVRETYRWFVKDMHTESLQPITANASAYWNDDKNTFEDTRTAYLAYKNNGMSGLILLSQEQYELFKNNPTIESFRKCVIIELIATELDRQFSEQTKIPPNEDSYFYENSVGTRIIEASAQLKLPDSELDQFLISLKKVVFKNVEKVRADQQGEQK